MTRRKPHTVEDRTEKDICVVLRSYADGAVSRGVTVPPNIAVKAAAEIERLRAMSRRLLDALDDMHAKGETFTARVSLAASEMRGTLEQSAGDNGVRQTNDEVDTDKP